MLLIRVSLFIIFDYFIINLFTEGVSVLHSVGYHGNSKSAIARHLVSLGANINAVDKSILFILYFFYFFVIFSFQMGIHLYIILQKYLNTFHDAGTYYTQ